MKTSPSSAYVCVPSKPRAQCKLCSHLRTAAWVNQKHPNGTQMHKVSAIDASSVLHARERCMLFERMAGVTAQDELEAICAAAGMHEDPRSAPVHQGRS